VRGIYMESTFEVDSMWPTRFVGVLTC